MTRLHIVHLFILLTAVACAEGDVGGPDSGMMSGGPDTTVTPRDMGGGPTSNGTSDMPNPPTNNEPFCQVNETICLTETRVGRCRPDQKAYDPVDCESNETCNNGACTTEQVCTPDSLECLDDRTVLRCRATGEGYIQMTCEEGLNCGDGVCTDKLPTGAGCTTDDECATGNCRCGSGTDDNCPPELGGGICANTSCTADSCGLSAHCLASGRVPTGAADYDHCVRSCDTANTCPTGSKCVEVPVHTMTGVEYRSACYFANVKGFGDDCSADAECLSGACLTDYFDTGFCSRRCDTDGVCASGSGCVRLRPNEYWCSLLCGDGSFGNSEPCPLDVPEERFDVTCKDVAKQGGGVLRVCAAP